MSATEMPALRKALADYKPGSLHSLDSIFVHITVLAAAAFWSLLVALSGKWGTETLEKIALTGMTLCFMASAISTVLPLVSKSKSRIELLEKKLRLRSFLIAVILLASAATVSLFHICITTFVVLCLGVFLLVIPPIYVLVQFAELCQQLIPSESRTAVRWNISATLFGWLTYFPYSIIILASS